MNRFPILLAVAAALVAPTAASASDPIENLSPADGSTIEGHGRYTYVEFTCPAYGRYTWEQYNVNFSTSSEIGEWVEGEGKLGTWRDVHSSAILVDASQGTCKAETPWLVGEAGKTNTWYWQVERQDCTWVRVEEHQACQWFGPIWEVNIDQSN